MSLAERINLVQNYLISHHMYAEHEWIAGCVEYLMEDNGNNYNESDILNLAKEQWMLNDLKDMCPGSLPRNLKNEQKNVLNGRYVIQINAAIDIGTPAYQQYLKLQKVNMENIEATTTNEEKIGNHRMLKLYITDGVQDVTAIEYKLLRNLSCDITPGCKALIKGPIECRRGMLLLTEGSIELLGGEVQEMVVTNSLPRLLASKLELNINEVANETQNPPVPTIPIPPQNQEVSIARNEVGPQYAQVTHNRPVARVTSVQVVDNFVDDDIDIEELDAIEAKVTDVSNKRLRTDDVVRTENKMKKNIGIRETEDYPNENPKPEKKMKIDSSVRQDYTKDNTDSKAKRSEANCPLLNKEYYPDDEDDLFLEDEDHLREVEEKFDIKYSQHIEAKYPVVVPSEPFLYIKQLNDMRDCDKDGRVVRVKGQILKLLSKLSVSKDSWSLKCVIVDGTGTMDVDFSSDVLSKLVGLSPQEMNQIKKDMGNNPDLKQKAVSALQKAKDSLQVLYCIIELTMLEVPKITCLIPFHKSDVNKLKRRLQESGL